VIDNNIYIYILLWNLVEIVCFDTTTWYYHYFVHSLTKKNKKMNEYCTITFQVTCPAEPGETLYLSGDHGALGGYVPEHAREMFTTAELYPVWKVKVLLPRGIKLVYNYLKKEGGELSEWEFAVGVSRTLNSEEAIVTLNDTYGVLPHDYSSSHPVSSEDEGATTTTTNNNNSTFPSALSSKQLILVAFNLPVFLRRDSTTNSWRAEWDTDNVAAKTEGSVADSMHVTWIGAVTPTVVRSRISDDPSNKEDCFCPSEETKTKWTEALNKLGTIIPVFLDREIYELHYVQFCKVRLWDIFHNVLRPKFSAQPAAPYSIYDKGNSIFAHEVMKRVQPEQNNKSTIVWVHDYHLMLVPKMLRDQLDFAGSIIFFLHTPFPTSEIFRTLPTRHELLAGMLASTIIGFHTFNHGRHFVTACKRFLGATSRSKDGHIVVEWRDRRVLITISHLGIDAMHLTNTMASPEANLSKQQISDRLKAFVPKSISNDIPPGMTSSTTFLGGSSSVFLKSPTASNNNNNNNNSTPTSNNNRVTVFGAYNATQRLRGVPMKLLAFERLLSNSHELRHGRIRFVLWTISATSGPRLHDSTRSLKEIRTLVRRINDAHQAELVIHREFTNDTPPTLAERLGLWANVDVYVNTAVSEGLNLMPLEYCFCRGENTPGVLILSEFATCSSVLNGAIRVNCYDVKGISSAMESVLSMSLEEKKARRQRDVTYITYPASLWAQHLIERVLRTTEDLSTSATVQLDSSLSIDSGRALSHVVQCKPLDAQKVAKAYENSKRRLFLLDFGGTLVEREHENLALKRDFLGVHGRGLSQRVRRYLRILSSDPRNLVFVISSDTRTVLARVFSELLERPGSRLGVVAHSGLFIRIPNAFTDSSMASMEEVGIDVDLQQQQQQQQRQRQHQQMDGSEDDSENEGTSKIGYAKTSSTSAAAAATATAAASQMRERKSSGGFVPTMSLIEEKQLMTLRASGGGGNNNNTSSSTNIDTSTNQQQQQQFPTQRKTSRDIGAASTRDVYLSTFNRQHSLQEDVDEWRLMVSNVAGKSWSRWLERGEVIPIMERYTWSTGGAQFSSSSITDTFDYTRADSEWGLTQANSLVAQLTASLQKHHLTNLVAVRHAKGVVQLLPRGVDKGRAANDIMQNFCNQNLAWAGEPPDFCVCVGDDASDEFMFEAVHDYFIKHEGISRPSIFTSTVGRKPTKARYYLRDVEAVHGFLQVLCDVNRNRNNNNSNDNSNSSRKVREEDLAVV
jgi:trehalose 6-phosphate synthase/phosphatase